MRSNNTPSRTRMAVASLVAVAALGLTVHIASARHLNTTLSFNSAGCGFLGGNPVVAQATGHLLSGAEVPGCKVWTTGGTATADCPREAVRTRVRIGVLLAGGQGTFSQAPAPFAAATSGTSTSWTGFASATAEAPAVGGCPAQTFQAMSWGHN